ncbi:MAG: acyltransferase family protein [Bacteroidales bacterium]|nr:acyltransferase family protein [Bacteroidales bacterium]
MNRVLYLDILRIMAIIAVVMLHVSAQRFYVSFPSYEWEVRMFFNSMVRWGVPIFVMISGALFLDPQKKISLAKL